MIRKVVLHHTAGRVLRKAGVLLIGLVMCLPAMNPVASAQVTTAITPTSGAGNLGTTVTQAGTTYNITNGTKTGGNLFHSFSEFSIGELNIARFQTSTLTPDVSVSNILSRVTGGTPSQLFGTIDSATFYPGANLFFMNPAGIVFGPAASLNIGGSVAFTTASYVRLAEANGSNAGIFHADPGLTSLLTSAPVAAFGFLSPNAAPITFEGSSLSVPLGQSFSLVGGDITIRADPTTGSPSLITAPSGEIRLASVASAGEVLSPTLRTAPNINGAVFDSMGTIRIDGFSTLDVSDSALAGMGSGGTVSIRGGQFIMDGGFISSGTLADAPGAQTAVRIDMTGDITLRNGSGIFTSASGTGQQGDIDVTGRNITLESGSFITTLSAESAEQGGNIIVRAQNLTVLDGSTIFTGTTGEAASGNISVTATDSVSLSGIDPIFGTRSAIEAATFAAGNGGSLSVQSDTITVVTSGHISTTSVGNGRAGDLQLQSRLLQVQDGGLIDSNGGNGSGAIRIVADEITVSGHAGADQRSRIENVGGGEGGTGDIYIRANRFLLTNDARVNMVGDGQLGTITIVADESLTVASGGKVRMENDAGPGGFVNLLSPHIVLNQGIIQTLTVGSGNAGAVSLSGTDILINGGQINSSTCFSACGAGGGLGGDVSLNATRDVTINGQFAGRILDNQLDPAGPAGIFTRSGNTGNNAGNISVMATNVRLADRATISSETTGSDNAGNILVKADNITISGGARITAASTGLGNAGAVTIQGINSPANSVLIEGTGTGIFTNTENRGTGGDISIETAALTIQDGGMISATTTGIDALATGGNINITASQAVDLRSNASISASSTGPADAGNISINAGNKFEARDSSVTTKSQQAGGGNIEINALDQIRLVNSQVNASALLNGGNVSIDPNLVILQNSSILAQAIQGNGGNITIFTPLFLADSSSLVSASSQFGLNGTVTIQNPTSNLSGSLGTLATKPRQAQSLLTQRCAALANGQASSFVVAGREQLPADPGGWLTSPLAFAGIDPEGFGEGAVAEGTSNLAPRTSGLLANGTVSLRLFTPTGFLMANYADSEATGCHS